jgi:OFA family oxalate/formate antiporter-like MFS transporter
MSQKPGRVYILIACTCAVFWPGAFIFGYPGIMRHYWQQAFNVGGSAVGQTIFFILTGATCFMYLCGRWQEKYGPGKLAALGAVLTGSSVIWLGRTESMTAVHAWAFLIGAASAFIYVPALTTVQRWYPERRGLVSGLCNMAFGLAAAVMSPIFTALLSGWDYETTNLVLGCAALIIGVPAAALIRFPQVDPVMPAAGAAIAPASRTVVEALKSREFWCIWLTWVLAGAAGASMLVLATGFGLARGLNLSQAVILLTGFNLTNGCGRLVAGFFSDRLGRSRMMSISFIAAAVAYLIMPHLEGIHGAFRGHLRVDFHRLRVFGRPARSVAERLYSGFHPGQLHPCVFLSWPYVSGFGRTHPASSTLARMPDVISKKFRHLLPEPDPAGLVFFLLDGSF